MRAQVYLHVTAVIVMAGFIGANSARAKTWDGEGTNNNWSVAANWDMDTVPKKDGTEAVTFAGGVRLSPLTDQAWEVRSVIFNSSAAAFVLSGEPLGIWEGGVDNGSANLQTISNPVWVRAGHLWNAASGPLLLSGPVMIDTSTLRVGGLFTTTIQGPISGSGSVVKQGSGMLRLLGSNSCSGGLWLDAGVLSLGHNSALGTGPFYPGPAVIQGEGEPRLFGNAIDLRQNANPVFDSGVDLTFTGPVLLEGNRRLTVRNVGIVMLSGPVGGSSSGASLTLDGGGNLVLAGSLPNLLTGVVAVAGGLLGLAKPPGTNAIAGELEIGNGMGLGVVRLEGAHQISDGARVSVMPGGLLDLNGYDEGVRSLRMTGGEVATGSGVLTLREGIVAAPSNSTPVISGHLDLNNKNQVVLVVEGPAESGLTISASIANGSLYKGGTGTLFLSGSNTFAGGLTVAFGALHVGHDWAAGTGVLRLAEGGIRAEGGPRTLANPLLLGCRGCQVDPISDPVFDGTNDLIFTGPATLQGIPTFTVRNTGLTIFSGPMSEDEPGRGLTKDGAGILIFEGSEPNSYTGFTAVHEGVLLFRKTPGVNAIAGTLDIGAEGEAPGTARVQLGASDQIMDAARIRIRASGVLDLNGFSETGTLSMAGGSVVTGTGVFTLADDVTTGLSALTATLSGHLDLGGVSRVFDVIGGARAVDMEISATVRNGAIVKTGSGTLLLTGANQFSGGLVLGWGRLALGNDFAVGTGPLYLVTSDTEVLALLGARTISNRLYLSGTVGVGGTSPLRFTGRTTLLGNPVLVVSNTAVTELAGPIDENGVPRGLTKAGPGALVLSGQNSFSRGTVVEAGLLDLRGSQPNGPGALVANGGSVAVGRAPGTINAGNMVVGANAGLVAHLENPDGPALISVMNLALAGALTIEPGSGFGPGTYRLFDYSGSLSLGATTVGGLPPGYGYSLVTTNPGHVNLVITTTADTDGDGLPDAYELANGLDPNNPEDADMDRDGDGFTNRQEYYASTDPQDASDYLHILEIKLVGTEARITFAAKLGEFYRLERSNSNLVGPWTTALDNIPGLTGPVQVTDQDGGNQPTGFYRIMVLP